MKVELLGRLGGPALRRAAARARGAATRRAAASAFAASPGLPSGTCSPPMVHRNAPAPAARKPGGAGHCLSRGRRQGRGAGRTRRAAGAILTFTAPQYNCTVGATWRPPSAARLREAIRAAIIEATIHLIGPTAWTASPTAPWPPRPASRCVDELLLPLQGRAHRRGAATLAAREIERSASGAEALGDGAADLEATPRRSARGSRTSDATAARRAATTSSSRRPAGPRRATSSPPGRTDRRARRDACSRGRRRVRAPPGSCSSAPSTACASTGARAAAGLRAPRAPGDRAPAGDRHRA